MCIVLYFTASFMITWLFFRACVSRLLPRRDGIVRDWDAAEALMEHSLKNCLGCDPTDHPLLMAEPSFNPTTNRLKLTEIAFEKFNVPALFLSKNAVLAGTAAP